MKRMMGWGAVLVAAAAMATPARAQMVPLAFEVRAGATSPTGDFSNGLKGGVGLTGTVEVRVLPIPSVYLYGGYGLDRFNGEGDSEGLDVESRGFLLGGRVSAPTLFGALPVVPWARVGALFAELEGSEGNVSIKSDRSTGLDLGFGLEVQAAPMVKIVPGATYRSYRPSFDNVDSDDRVTFWVFDLGVRVAL